MDYKEYKYQWSSKADGGEIVVVRSDDKEDLILDIEWAKDKILPKPSVESQPERAETTSSEPEWLSLNDEYAGKTLDEIPEIDESYCDVHNVKMKEREGKNGKFYSHARDLGDNNWDYCSGKGWKSELKK